MTTSSAVIDLDVFRQPAVDDIVFLGLLLLFSVSYCLKGITWDKPDPYHHVWYSKPQQLDAAAKGNETRDIGLKLEQSKKNGVVFWGSQSGTAEGLANRLARDCRTRFGLDVLVADIAEYDSETICNIPDTIPAIFILSTYGEGDPSDNAVQLLAWLHTNQNASFPINMPNLRYAAFGLGNSNYKFYNRVIDVLTEALDQFQARPLIPCGKADDSKGATDEDFTSWKQDLFTMFRDHLRLKERPEKYEPSLKVVDDPSLDIVDLHVGEPFKTQSLKKAQTVSSPIQTLPVKLARTLFSAPDHNCFHLEIDTIEYPELKYKTGDHLAVWPSNPKSEVNRLLDVLGLQARKDTPLLISNLEASTATKVPSPTNLDALFAHYLEICAPVPRETVLSLAQFAQSPRSKSFLTQLGTSKEAYNDHCSRNHVTLGRLLESASSLTEVWSTLPLSFVLEILSPLQPRRYSISSSSIVSPNTIALTISTTTCNTPQVPGLPISVPGLTTGYIAALSESFHRAKPSDFRLTGPSNLLAGGKIFASIVPSKFRLPALPKHPLILVASGSGIAPFRGFLQEQARLFKLGREVGPMTLFFGCRSSSEFLYADEFTTLCEEMDGKLKIVTAFSREGPQKIYVQDQIQAQIIDVVRQLDEDNAHIYICGSAAMARDVGRIIGEGVKGMTISNDAELRAWSEKMKRSRRWQEDVWG